MSAIEIVGLCCTAAGIVLAVLSSTRAKPQMPCAFCGKPLNPPLYACRHSVGDGRGGPAA